MNNSGYRGNSASSIPKFLVDDAKEGIEAAIENNRQCVNSEVQTAVDDFASEAIEDFADVIVGNAIQQFAVECQDETKDTKELLESFAATLQVKADEYLNHMVRHSEELGRPLPQGKTEVFQLLQETINTSVTDITGSLSSFARR